MVYRCHKDIYILIVFINVETDFFIIMTYTRIINTKLLHLYHHNTLFPIFVCRVPIINSFIVFRTRVTLLCKFVSSSTHLTCISLHNVLLNKLILDSVMFTTILIIWKKFLMVINQLDYGIDFILYLNVFLVWNFILEWFFCNQICES